MIWWHMGINPRGPLIWAIQAASTNHELIFLFALLYEATIMKKNAKRWHDAIQKALSLSHLDGIVRAFEKLVGSSPIPSDKLGYEIHSKLLET
jgi:hypothetical protein